MVRRLLLLVLFACHRPAPPAQARRDAAPVAPRIDAAVAPRIDAAPDAPRIDAAVAPRIDAAPAAPDAPRIDAAPIDAGIHYAREGEVCRKGGARGALSPETPCEPGLHCCYPCGIQGCAYVCKRVCISAP